jgi:hypothetical protein
MRILACRSSSLLLRSVFTALFIIGIASARANADVCVTIDETRDLFSPQERTAALLLLTRQFELAGERVIPAACDNPYRVSHVPLGNMINITLSGPNGQRDALAVGFEDVPAVYSQMVRSLLSNRPMEARGVVDRTNVTVKQSEVRRVHADSIVYARLGFGAIFGDRAYGGPSVGLFGYRKELDAFAIDVSFLNVLYKSSETTSAYSPGGSSGMTGDWLKLQVLHFISPLSDRTFYAGGGLSWNTANISHANTTWSGSGLAGVLTTGYEVGRASTLRVFMQIDAGLPFYKLGSEAYAYSNSPPYVTYVTTGHRYAPTLGVSIGLGWQRGGGK